MERSRKIEEVGDSVSPILEQNEKTLRFNADQGLLIFSEPLSLKYTRENISGIGHFLKNSSQEDIRVDGCNQIPWNEIYV